MKADLYLRGVLTVIAGALVYLCVILSPLPAISAQTAQRPGDPTGPAEMVIVGVRQGVALPVQMQGPVMVSNEVRVTGEVKVTGRVQTEQAPRTLSRVVLTGWEDGGAGDAPGSLVRWNRATSIALPVAPYK